VNSCPSTKKEKKKKDCDEDDSSNINNKNSNKHAIREHSHMYVLDLQHNKEWLTIDSEYLGNVSRFFNHSCEPNLDVKKIIIRGRQCYDVAFFANQDIEPGTELTWRYTTEKTSDSMPCNCGSSDCRGWY